MNNGTPLIILLVCLSLVGCSNTGSVPVVATAMAGEAISVELAVQRERMTNKVKAIVPWVILVSMCMVFLALAFATGTLLVELCKEGLLPRRIHLGYCRWDSRSCHGEIMQDSHTNSLVSHRSA